MLQEPQKTMTNRKVPDVFSTHSAARFCRVTPMTIIRWIEEGRIRAYKTPGGHRRIMRADLEDFCRRAGIPVEWETQAPENLKKVLIIDDDSSEVNAILDALLDDEAPDSPKAFKVEHTDNAFDGGQLLGSFKPDILFLSLTLPGISPHSVVASIRRAVTDTPCRVVGIGESTSPRDVGVDRLLVRPLAAREVKQATGPMPIIRIPD